MDAGSPGRRAQREKRRTPCPTGRRQFRFPLRSPRRVHGHGSEERDLRIRQPISPRPARSSRPPSPSAPGSPRGHRALAPGMVERGCTCAGSCAGCAPGKAGSPRNGGRVRGPWWATSASHRRARGGFASSGARHVEWPARLEVFRASMPGAALHHGGLGGSRRWMRIELRSFGRLAGRRRLRLLVLILVRLHVGRVVRLVHVERRRADDGGRQRSHGVVRRLAGR